MMDPPFPQTDPPYPQRVAQVLSGRVPLRRRGNFGPGNPSTHWKCPCGETHVRIGNPPMTLQCRYCKRVYTVYDPFEEPS